MSQRPTQQGQAQTILVTGANGFVGKSLIPALLAAGHSVIAGVRTPATMAGHQWSDEIEIRHCDVTDPASLKTATKGVDCVYYLVHSMAGKNFVARDAQGARNMVEACELNDVGRTIYLGGLVPTGQQEPLSDHLRSRLEVEQILGSSTIPNISLRAGVIIGTGSASYVVLKHLVDILPVIPAPAWLSNRVEPIALDDVVRCLTGAATAQGVTGSVEVGAGETFTYLNLMKLVATVNGRWRPSVPLPNVPTSLAGTLIGWVTPGQGATVEALVDSLTHTMVCTSHDKMNRLLGADSRACRTITSALHKARDDQRLERQKGS